MARMAYKLNRTGSPLSREERVKIDQNWGVIEKALDDTNDAANKANKDIATALAKSTSAEQTSLLAEAMAESTQTQLDTLVLNGDSSVEAAQARVDEIGESHVTLKARVDDGIKKVTSLVNDNAYYHGVSYTRNYDTASGSSYTVAK